MLVALDTSCVINLLSGDSQPDDALLDIVRRGLGHLISIRVTPVVDEEIPKPDGIARRDFVKAKVAEFPVLDVDASDRAAAAERAEVLRRLLWPNADETSTKQDHCRRDCLHLVMAEMCAVAVFVTGDDKLAKKVAGHPGCTTVRVLSPSDALSVLPSPPRSPADRSWQPVVRTARDADAEAIRALLAPIKDSYDDFDKWLTSSFSGAKQGTKHFAVGEIGGEIAGIAIWAPKDKRVAKLATFYVRPDARGHGLGPHLIFEHLRTWVAAGFEKVIVTVSEARRDALEFFLGYGFRIEGASSRRYKAGLTEFVLAKHLYYRRVLDADLAAFLDQFSREVLGVAAPAQDARRWFLPPTAHHLRPVHHAGRLVGVEVVDGAGAVTYQVPFNRFEELVYPARFATSGRRAFMIPIQPQWADRMMEVPRSQGTLFRTGEDRLRLRTDNAYYLHPRYVRDQDVEGSPVLFYVSDPDKMVAGTARILERRIAPPEDLFLEYERMGVYGISNIRDHVENAGEFAGCAMAIRFAWWVPFPKPIPLQRLREELGLHHPQTMEAIDFEVYERVLEAGGVEW